MSKSPAINEMKKIGGSKMIDMSSASHSPGYYVFVGFCVVAALWLIVSVVMMFVDLVAEAIMSLLVLAVVVVLANLSYYPWSDDFHTYYNVTGTVAQKPETRIIKDGDSMSQRAVLKFKEGNGLWGVDDTRATAVQVGDVVTLRCKREFEFNSVPGWVCKWNTK